MKSTQQRLKVVMINGQTNPVFPHNESFVLRNQELVIHQPHSTLSVS